MRLVLTPYHRALAAARSTLRRSTSARTRLRRRSEPGVTSSSSSSSMYSSALLERHGVRRRQLDVLVAAGRADVRELLLAADVDAEVACPCCARRRSCPRRPGARGDEELAAVEQAEERVGHRVAGAVGDQDAVRAPRDRAPGRAPRPRRRGSGSPRRGSASSSAVRAPIRPREGTRNSMRVCVPSAPIGSMSRHLAAAPAEVLDHLAGRFRSGTSIAAQLDRLAHPAVDVLEDHVRLADARTRSPRGACSRPARRGASRRGP